MQFCSKSLTAYLGCGRRWQTAISVHEQLKVAGPLRAVEWIFLENMGIG